MCVFVSGCVFFLFFFFFSSRRRHTRYIGDWSSDVCSSDLGGVLAVGGGFFFGLWWGFLVVFAGNIIGAAISFALSRWVTGQWFRQKLSQNPTLRALEPAVQRESWKIVLLSQLQDRKSTRLNSSHRCSSY